MRPGRPTLLSIAAILLGSLASACATYQTELQQGIKYYDENTEYEKSLAIFRVLEPDIDSLSPDNRVRYYYYRGMTDYRLNSDKYDVAPDARHWLALAAVGESNTPSSLNGKQIGLMCDALGELNKRAYNQSASDVPVTEFKVCKDRSDAAGVVKDKSDPDKKDKDEPKSDDKPRKKKSDG